MYRLYYAPRSASFLPHVALEEIGAPFELINPFDKGFPGAYERINPMRRVPALETEDGILTEGQAIVTYLAIRHPEAKLLPPEQDLLARARAHEIMNLFVNAHLIAVQLAVHPDWFSTDESAFEAIKAGGRARLERHILALEDIIQNRLWAAGQSWSIADVNLLMIYRWGKMMDMPLDRCRNLERIARAVYARPATQRAMATEGITLD